VRSENAATPWGVLTYVLLTADSETHVSESSSNYTATEDRKRCPHRPCFNIYAFIIKSCLLPKIPFVRGRALISFYSSPDNISTLWK
jgi:hypothetical protein